MLQDVLILVSVATTILIWHNPTKTTIMAPRSPTTKVASTATTKSLHLCHDWEEGVGVAEVVVVVAVEVVEVGAVGVVVVLELVWEDNDLPCPL